MRFQFERCLECGTPAKPVHVEANGYLNGNGKFRNTEFWFCSFRCFSTAVRELLPRKYQHESAASDLETKALIQQIERRYPHQHERPQRDEKIQACVDDWQQGQEEAIREGVHQLTMRLLGEQSHSNEKEYAEILETNEKAARKLADQIAKELAAMPPSPITLDDIPEHVRFSGNWIIAPPNRGKTVLLSHMFLRDVQRNASIIVMDSKGDLIGPIKQLRSIKDRLVLIEPDADYPLALNPFDIPRATPQHTVELLEYMISGLLGADLTELQLALFRNILPIIMKVIPQPTVGAFKEFLINGLENHQDQFQRLDDHERRFMTDAKNGFLSKTYSGTRDQVVWRIDYLTANQVIRKMFESPKTKFDMGQLMDEGKIIVIDNSKRLLTKDGCEFIGRFFVYLVLAAAMQRSGRPRNEKLPCFFYIDECYDVIHQDENIADIIDQCRSQNIAMILAHQRITQITSPNVLDALMNCAIRFANSDQDAKVVAANLRTKPEFLQSLPIGTFAAFVRDVTKEAAPISVPFVDIEALPKTSPSEMAAIRRDMHASYGFTRRETHKAPEGASYAPKQGSPKTSIVPPAPPRAEPPAQPSTEPPSEWASKW
jgi:hypothetical protein